MYYCRVLDEKLGKVLKNKQGWNHNIWKRKTDLELSLRYVVHYIEFSTLE